MLSAELEHRSLWQETASGVSCPRLERGLHVDVAIVGGGITGLTAALLLKRTGLRVAVLEAHTVGGENSLRTTAHLTEAVDARYATIEKDFGPTAAKEVAYSSHAAITRIRAFVRELKIDCVYRTVPGFLYTEREDDLRALHLEYEAAARAGIHVDMVREVPLPFRCAAAVRFPDQAQVHAGRYLEGLAHAISGDGCHVFERTLVRDVDEGEPCTVHVATGLDEGAPEQRVTCDRVIFATSAPPTRFALHTKLAHYRSYAIARVESGDVPLALFWDMDDPYHYTRIAEIFGKRYLVIGGEDHKTGQKGDAEDCWTRLEEYARVRFGVAPVTHRWSGQILEPVDGLPYIGKIPGKEKLSIGVGYSGNGMTFGTLAGMLLAEPDAPRARELLQLYAPSRVKPVASAKDFVAENVDFPAHFVGDRLRAPDARSVEEVERGEGKIVKLGGERLAVYRDDAGALHAFSPVCPHLGCHVAFNNAERSWDCPCHGSRFDTEGRLLHGPAARGLTAKKI
ncbi:FAD-dependent oxidoreductase [Pendulispora brunnea]|uniref:FAD-dependent oxidoreductase n=1 Tax=Pendulispora brunnea TaxID=2905690 RepID=A0ABZ2K2F9_9BACT